MTGEAAAHAGFASASRLLAERVALRLCAKQVERATEALGVEIAADEREAVEAERPSAPTMQIGIDGTGIPAGKSEQESRKGKQPDGSAKTRNYKLAVVWTAEKRDKETGLAMRDRGSASFTAAIESAPRRVVISDGAPRIWNLHSGTCPGAIEILDLFHAKEHLTDVAKAVCDAGSELAAAWTAKRQAELGEGRIHAVPGALGKLAPRCEQARKCRSCAAGRDRMRYANFREMGLCVGSGVVEAGCKNIAGARLKRSGMHWRGAGRQRHSRHATLCARWRFRGFPGKSGVQKTSGLKTLTCKLLELCPCVDSANLITFL